MIWSKLIRIIFVILAGLLVPIVIILAIQENYITALGAIGVQLVLFYDSGVNAGFNIAYLYKNKIPQFNIESDILKGNTDVPKVATL